MLKQIWNDDSGQGMVEYGLILALVSIAAIAAVKTVGGKVDGTFKEVGTKMETPGA